MTTIEYMKENSSSHYIVERKTCECGGKIMFADFSDGSEIEKCLDCGKEE